MGLITGKEFMDGFKEKSQNLVDGVRERALAGDESEVALLTLSKLIAKLVGARLRDVPVENPRVAAAIALSHAAAVLSAPALRGDLTEDEAQWDIRSLGELLSLAGALLIEKKKGGEENGDTQVPPGPSEE